MISLGCMYITQPELVNHRESLLAKTSDNKLIPSSVLSDSQIKLAADLVTVQIKNSEQKALGTGVIVGRENFPQSVQHRYLYSVLTAHHVIKHQKRKNKTIVIVTTDGIERIVELNSATQIATNDLALLYFSSSNQYSHAKIGSSDNIGKVFSAGFPCEKNFCKDELEISPGIVAPKEILEGHKSFQDGIGIGHDGNIYSGMSGGPILDIRGNLVGINNRKKYPPLILENNKPRYIDGSKPSQLVEEIFPFFAWGTPIEEYVDFKKTYRRSRKVKESSELGSTTKINDLFPYYKNSILLLVGFLFLSVVLSFANKKNKSRRSTYRLQEGTSISLPSVDSASDDHITDDILPNQIKLAEIEVIQISGDHFIPYLLFLDVNKRYVHPSKIYPRYHFNPFREKHFVLSYQNIIKNDNTEFIVTFKGFIQEKKPFKIELEEDLQNFRIKLEEPQPLFSSVGQKQHTIYNKSVWHLYCSSYSLFNQPLSKSIKINLRFIYT